MPSCRCTPSATSSQTTAGGVQQGDDRARARGGASGASPLQTWVPTVAPAVDRGAGLLVRGVGVADRGDHAAVDAAARSRPARRAAPGRCVTMRTRRRQVEQRGQLVEGRGRAGGPGSARRTAPATGTAPRSARRPARPRRPAARTPRSRPASGRDGAVTRLASMVVVPWPRWNAAAARASSGSPVVKVCPPPPWTCMSTKPGSDPGRVRSASAAAAAADRGDPAALDPHHAVVDDAVGRDHPTPARRHPLASVRLLRAGPGRAGRRRGSRPRRRARPRASVGQPVERARVARAPPAAGRAAPSPASARPPPSTMSSGSYSATAGEQPVGERLDRLPPDRAAPAARRPRARRATSAAVGGRAGSSRRSARPIAAAEAIASRQPRPPQPQRRASGPVRTTMWPISPAAPCAPGSTRPSTDVAAGDAGADGDEEHPPRWPPPGAEPGLGQRAGPHVVAERRGQAEPRRRPGPAAARRGSRGSPTRRRRRRPRRPRRGRRRRRRPGQPWPRAVRGEAGGDVEDRRHHGVGAALGAGRRAARRAAPAPAGSTSAHLIPVPPTSRATATVLADDYVRHSRT